MKKFIFLFFITNTFLQAQFDEFDPDYEWYTIKGEHVVVHFHEETERTARTVLKIAEEVWDPITSLYKYEPDLVHYIIPRTARMVSRLGDFRGLESVFKGRPEWCDILF